MNLNMGSENGIRDWNSVSKSLLKTGHSEILRPPGAYSNLERQSLSSEKNPRINPNRKSPSVME